MHRSEGAGSRDFSQDEEKGEKPNIAEVAESFKRQIQEEGKDKFFSSYGPGDALILAAEGFIGELDEIYPDWSEDDFKALLKEIGFPYEEIISNSGSEMLEKFTETAQEMDGYIHELLACDPTLKRRKLELYEAAESIGRRFKDFATETLHLTDGSGKWKMPEGKTEQDVALAFAAYAAQAEFILQRINESVPSEILMSRMQQGRTPSFVAGSIFDMACHAAHVRSKAYNLAEGVRVKAVNI